MDTVGKAQALGRQYESVFTDEDMFNIPNLPAQTTTIITAIANTSCGVAKLLKALDPSKANVPDCIPTKVIKECAQEISPVLQRIDRSSINKVEVLRDWRTANIVAVFH